MHLCGVVLIEEHHEQEGGVAHAVEDEEADGDGVHGVLHAPRLVAHLVGLGRQVPARERVELVGRACGWWCGSSALASRAPLTVCRP